MRWVCVKLLASAVCAMHFIIGNANAADIRLSDHPNYDVILEGVIEIGDYDKFRKLVDDTCPINSYSRSCPSKIFLASPGGSVAEALKIGRFIRELRWTTQIPIKGPENLRAKIINALKLKGGDTNFVCASACFFLFVAGIERDSEPRLSLLGVHRPYLSNADLKKLKADQAIDSAKQIRAIVETYLKEIGVRDKYVDLMFSIPKDEVRWISESELEADFNGIIQELKDWMDAQCVRSPKAEKFFNEMDEKAGRGETVTPYERVLREILRAQGHDPSVHPIERRVNCEASAMERLRSAAWKRRRGR